MSDRTCEMQTGGGDAAREKLFGGVYYKGGFSNDIVPLKQRRVFNAMGDGRDAFSVCAIGYFDESRLSGLSSGPTASIAMYPLIDPERWASCLHTMAPTTVGTAGAEEKSHRLAWAE